jgi:hypothetical protein
VCMVWTPIVGAGSIDGVGEDSLSIWCVVGDYTHCKWAWFFQWLSG